MASIYKELLVNAPPQFVWEAIKDVGAVQPASHRDSSPIRSLKETPARSPLPMASSSKSKSSP